MSLPNSKALLCQLKRTAAEKSAELALWEAKIEALQKRTEVFAPLTSVAAPEDLVSMFSGSGRSSVFATPVQSRRGSLAATNLDQACTSYLPVGWNRARLENALSIMAGPGDISLEQKRQEEEARRREAAAEAAARAAAQLEESERQRLAAEAINARISSGQLALFFRIRPPLVIRGECRSGLEYKGLESYFLYKVSPSPNETGKLQFNRTREITRVEIDTTEVKLPPTETIDSGVFIDSETTFMYDLVRLYNAGIPLGSISFRPLLKQRGLLLNSGCENVNGQILKSAVEGRNPVHVVRVSDNSNEDKQYVYKWGELSRWFSSPSASFDETVVITQAAPAVNLATYEPKPVAAGNYGVALNYLRNLYPSGTRRRSTIVAFGSSGAGKSSLVNNLLPDIPGIFEETLMRLYCIDVRYDSVVDLVRNTFIKKAQSCDEFVQQLQFKVCNGLDEINAAIQELQAKRPVIPTDINPSGSSRSHLIYQFSEHPAAEEKRPLLLSERKTIVIMDLAGSENIQLNTNSMAKLLRNYNAANPKHQLTGKPAEYVKQVQHQSNFINQSLKDMTRFLAETQQRVNAARQAGTFVATPPTGGEMTLRMEQQRLNFECMLRFLILPGTAIGIVGCMSPAISDVELTEKTIEQMGEWGSYKF